MNVNKYTMYPPWKNKSPLKIGRNSQMTANIHLTWPPCLSVENNLKLYRSKHVLPKRTGKKNDINTRLTTISIELTMNSWKQDMKCETPLKLINDWIYYSLFGCEWKKETWKNIGTQIVVSLMVMSPMVESKKSPYTNPRL